MFFFFFFVYVVKFMVFMVLKGVFFFSFFIYGVLKYLYGELHEVIQVLYSVGLYRYIFQLSLVKKIN